MMIEPKLECPVCKSNNINQYRMPHGAIWCEDCNYRAEHKEEDNPFIPLYFRGVKL